MDILDTEWEQTGGRTDEQEIALRRDRAQREALACRRIAGPDPLFADYAVWHCDRENSTRYGVEIRVAGEMGNWCDCPDFRKSGLGICKHIIFVLQQEDVAPLVAAGRRSSRAEVYLDPTGAPRVELSDSSTDVDKDLVGHWVGEEARLLSPWQHTLGQFLGAVDAAPPDVRKRFRISKGVRDLAGALGRRQRREALRRQTEGVLRRMGARHLMGRDLNAVQTAGMLHLAFAGRAVLGDDCVHEPHLQALAAAQLLRERGEARRILVVVPDASRIDLWKEAIVTCTESAALLALAEGQGEPAAYTVLEADVAAGEIHAINGLLEPDLIIVDDAGACCPLKSERTRLLKRLRSTNLFALYGADLDDDLDALYSVVDWVEPSVLGSLFRFNREFREIDDSGAAGELLERDALLERIASVWLRRTTQSRARAVGEECAVAGGAAADAFARELQMRRSESTVLLRAEVDVDGFVARGLLVCRGAVERTEAAVADAWRRTHGERARSLTVLPESDWLMVQRLQLAGWVGVSDRADLRDLIGKRGADAADRAERLRRVESLLDEVRRQCRMAEVLEAGGCVIDAVEPAGAAVLKIGRALAWVNLDGVPAVPERLTSEMLQRMQRAGILSEAGASLLSSVASFETAGEIRAAWFLRQVREFVAETSGLLEMPNQ